MADEIVPTKTSKFLQHFQPFANIYFIGLVILLILAAILRWKYLGVESLWWDEARYLTFVAKTLEHPLALFSAEVLTRAFPLAIGISAIFSLFLKNVTFATKLVISLFSLAGIALIYFLGAELRNRATGLIAAILLTFANIFWFLSTRALLDVPVMTMFLATFFCLLKFEKHKTTKWAIFLGISIGATLWTNVQALVIIPIIAVYLAIKYYKEIFSLLKKPSEILTLLKDKNLWIVIGVILIFAVILYSATFYHFGSFTSRSLAAATSKMAATSTLQNLMFHLQHIPQHVSIYFLPLAIIGIVFSLLYRKKEDILLFCWTLVFLAFFARFVAGGIERYILPIVPAFFIWAAISLDEIKNLFKKYIQIAIPTLAFIILVALLCIPSYQTGTASNTIKSFSYTGYQEAGEWLKYNAPGNALIFSASTQQIQYYTGREWWLYNGTLYDLSHTTSYLCDDPKKGCKFAEGEQKTRWEKFIDEHPGPKYIELDLWEPKTSDFLTPLSQEVVTYLSNHRFAPVKIITKQIPTQQGLKEAPVIVIFASS